MWLLLFERPPSATPPQSTTTINAKSLIFHFGGARDMKNGLFTCGDATVLLSPVCSDAFAISTGSCYLAVCRFKHFWCLKTNKQKTGVRINNNKLVWFGRSSTHCTEKKSVPVRARASTMWCSPIHEHNSRSPDLSFFRVSRNVFVWSPKSTM